MEKKMRDPDKVHLFLVHPDTMSDDAAITKGIEYFVELFMFYGIIFSIIIYEVGKSTANSAKTKKRIETLVKSQQQNEDDLRLLQLEFDNFEEPQKFHDDKTVYLNSQIHLLQLMLK